MKNISKILAVLPILAASSAFAESYVYMQTASSGHTAYNNGSYYKASDVLGADGKIDTSLIPNVGRAGIAKPTINDDVFFGTYVGSASGGPTLVNKNSEIVYTMAEMLHNANSPVTAKTLTFGFNYADNFRSPNTGVSYKFQTDDAGTATEANNSITVADTLSVLGGKTVNFYGQSNLTETGKFRNYSLVDLGRVYLETTDTTSGNAKAQLSFGDYIKETRIGVNQMGETYESNGLVSELKSGTVLTLGGTKYDNHTGIYLGDANNAGTINVNGGTFYNVGTIENSGTLSIRNNAVVKNATVNGGSFRMEGGSLDGTINLTNASFSTKNGFAANFGDNTVVNATVKDGFWVNFNATAGSAPKYDGTRTQDVVMGGVYNLKGSGEYLTYSDDKVIQQVYIAGKTLKINELNLLGNFACNGGVDLNMTVIASNGIDINKMTIAGSDSTAVAAAKNQMGRITSNGNINIGTLEFRGGADADNKLGKIEFRIFNNNSDANQTTINDLKFTGYSSDGNWLSLFGTRNLTANNVFAEKTFYVNQEHNSGNASFYPGTVAKFGNITVNQTNYTTDFSRFILKQIDVSGTVSLKNVAANKMLNVEFGTYVNTNIENLVVGGSDSLGTMCAIFSGSNYPTGATTREDLRTTDNFGTVTVNQKGTVYFGGRQNNSEEFSTIIKSATVNDGTMFFGKDTKAGETFAAKIGTLAGTSGQVGMYDTPTQNADKRTLNLTLGTDTAGTSVFYGRVHDTMHANDYINIVKNGANTQILAAQNNSIKGTITVNEGMLGYASSNKVESVTVNGGEFASWNNSSMSDLSIGTLNMNGGKLHFDFNIATNSALSLAKNSDLIGSILSSDFTFANIVADTSYILFSFEDGSMNSYLQAIVDSEDNGKYKYIDKASGQYYFAKFAAEDGTGEFSVMFSVPEPSTWAAIFGALALAFAIYRRRK